MGRRTKASLVCRRSLNQALIHASRAPAKEFLAPRGFVRALRSALRMSQAQLSRRSGVPQAHIARLESGKIEADVRTIRRLFDAMYCDLLILPRARKRPSDAVAERSVERPSWRGLWD